MLTRQERNVSVTTVYNSSMWFVKIIRMVYEIFVRVVGVLDFVIMHVHNANLEYIRLVTQPRRWRRE